MNIEEARQDFMDIVYSELESDPDNCRANRIIEVADEYAQSAQPQRTSHWVNGHYDKCNAHAPFWAMASTYYESNFCPHCGAKMVGVSE